MKLENTTTLQKAKQMLADYTIKQLSDNMIYFKPTATIYEYYITYKLDNHNTGTIQLECKYKDATEYIVNAEQNNDFIRVVSITNKANRTYKEYKYLRKYDLIITEAHTILKYKNNLIKSEV